MVQSRSAAPAVCFLLALLVCVLAPTAGAQAPPSDYQVGPKDLLEIRVQDIPELNVERRVLDSGMIDLPLLGQVQVNGLTSMEIRDRLTALLMAKYVNQAYVTVIVKDFANRPITILGGVARPGTLNVSGRWTLQQAILSAGGLVQGAGRKIAILRTSENGLSDRIEVNADDLFVRLSPMWNIPIYPGDIVNVGMRQEITIYTLGEFKTTGAIKLQSDEKITLLTLVARLGGLTDKAAKGSLRIKRTEPNGKIRELVVNYNRILAGKDPDVPLQADDMVIARESLF